MQANRAGLASAGVKVASRGPCGALRRASVRPENIMPTAFIKGDIFETPGLTSFAFGAKVDGLMDVGIAIAIKKRWPAFAEAFAAHCAGGAFALGDVFMWTDGEATLFALGIQRADMKHSLTALNNSLMRMLDLAATAKIKRIGVPRLGTGAAGLDWARVRKMLGEITVGQAVRIDVFEQFIRAAKPNE
jgi:O-acetyl-ADP-ribose deacetylase (regulator of RNase III)